MFNLTKKEFKAAEIFVQSCLDAMGGERPSDLEQDEYTWISLGDLTAKGYSRHEAAGLMSSLADKGFISEHEPHQWVVETRAWQWIDQYWD